MVGVVVRHPWRASVAALVLLGSGLWAWWATQLRGLPDVGDPFDVAAFRAVQVPDDRNAFVEYRIAASLNSRLQRAIQAKKQKALRYQDYQIDWSKVDESWRDYLARSTEALATWRAGSEKPDARYDHPEGLSMRTLLPVSQELRTLGRLGVLEGSRLEIQGDMAGAWGWYRSALRASRHSGMHGFPVERLIGAAGHDEAARALTRWASDPRVDAPLLRRALAEVIAIDAMTVPRSDSLKVEYLLLVNSLGDPNLVEDVMLRREAGQPADWCQELPIPDAGKKPIQEARLVLADDRERSLRLIRLVIANWLAQVDKPKARRSKAHRLDPPIYEPDPSAPPASRALPPEELSRWLDSSLLAILEFRLLERYAFAIDRERTRQARLVVHLASELHRRDHGRPPASPEALVGPYLDRLPDEYAPDDAPDPVPARP